MSLSIGQIIKKLRKERNLTQEELAEQLDVTYQAISKWENGAGLPDISQVVPLARVFGVSTDVLFGTFGLNDDDEVQRIITKVNDEFINNVDKLPIPSDDFVYLPIQEQQYESLLEALKQYPNNIKLLCECLTHGSYLVGAYVNLINDCIRAEKVFKECIREANIIINYGKDMNSVMTAHILLVVLYSYPVFKDYEKATEHANMLPDGYINGFTASRGAMLAWINRAFEKKDEEIKERCNNISSILKMLLDEIRTLGDAYYEKEQYNDALHVYKSIFDIIPVIYEDEKLTPPLYGLNYFNVAIARCYWVLNDFDSAFSWLEKLINYHTINDMYRNKYTRLETPLLRECEFTFLRKNYGLKNWLLLDLSCVPVGMQETERFKILLDRVNSLKN